MSSLGSDSSDTAPLRHSWGWGSTKSSKYSPLSRRCITVHKISFVWTRQSESSFCISEEDTHIHQEDSHQDLNFRIWIVVMWGLCALNFIKELEAGRHDTSPISAHCGSPTNEGAPAGIFSGSFLWTASSCRAWHDNQKNTQKDWLSKETNVTPLPLGATSQVPRISSLHLPALMCQRTPENLYK